MFHISWMLQELSQIYKNMIVGNSIPNYMIQYVNPFEVWAFVRHWQRIISSV